MARCDVCGLPDRTTALATGIGSCDCPRCECGSTAHSVLCSCPPEDHGDFEWGDA